MPALRASRVGLATQARSTLIWLVTLALLNGLIFVLILPPWQHYDETAHFLYAAEIAAGELGAPGPQSAAISREIADSMYRFRFYQPELRPELFTPRPALVGIDQRVHPPLYYALVALPLRVVRALAIEQQLYVARSVSLALYVLTIVTVWRIAVALKPPDPSLQLIVPLLVILAPAFADIMAAVNNDVLLNFSATVAMLGAVLLVRDGLRPLPLALAALGILVAVMAKRVALVALIPMCIALFWAVRRAPLRWWALPLAGGVGVAALAAVCLLPANTTGPAGTHMIFTVRPWFARLTNDYLRVDLDAVVRSLTNVDLVGQRYLTLIRVGFAGFWGHFAWGLPALPQLWSWIMAGMAALAVLGLALGGARTAADLPLWQRRCLWLFLTAVIVAWVSLFVRLHPLPPLDVPVYIPRGRYMFWAIVPNVALLVAGLTWATPRAWRPYLPYALVTLFVCLNLTAWLWTIPNYFYR